ncbi:amino acid ABC transporter permease, partial [Streptomyces sp. NPDC048370]
MTDKLDKVPDGASPAPSDLPPEAIKAIPVRHYGRWVAGVFVVALLVLLGYAFSQGNVRWATVPEKLFDSTI